MKIHVPTFLLLITLLTAACAQPPDPTPAPTSAPAEATETPAPPASPVPPSPTASAVPTEAPTETVTATTEAQADPTASATVASSLATLTPYPGPQPTAAPLNEPVPPVPTGDYECGAYPCFDDVAAWEARINLPPGFEARYVAQLEPHPTSMTFGPDGLLYLARQEGEILTVDEEGNTELYAGGFYHLVSLAFQPGTDRLFAASRAESNDEALIWIVEDGEPRVLYDGLPCCYGGWHQANGIAFGPDGYGYVPLGALSDGGEAGELHPLEATVLRFHPDGDEIEPIAWGLRNTFDITWDSQGRLFGADNMPDHGPPEEFNQIVPGAQHGFPYYDDCAGCTPTPPDEEIVGPLHELLAHSAPTGLTTYLHDAFPGYYDNIFLTLWSAFEGAQKIVRFGPGGEGMTDFATGFAAPVDVTVSPDGSLFTVDWATGIVFEIVYVGD
ncbi:MAG: PQQ-dependent sugar dehydrogenase [Chloroflexota bacterium]